MLCTITRTKKVVVGLTLVALVAQGFHFVAAHLYDIAIVDIIYTIMLHVVTPVSVLIINVIVVREVRRRASSDAATNLGVQHHQSTSSNSAVPTVMLVTTSLVYVLLNGATAILVITYMTTITDAIDPLFGPYFTINDLIRLVFAYNFYVYLITGKLFRSELFKLFCRCRSSSTFSSSDVAAVAGNVRVARHGQADTDI